jgi:hypothetical protein
MGMSSELRCDTCGLSTTVSGAPDCVFLVQTDTRFVRPVGYSLTHQLPGPTSKVISVLARWKSRSPAIYPAKLVHDRGAGRWRGGALSAGMRSCVASSTSATDGRQFAQFFEQTMLPHVAELGVQPIARLFTVEAPNDYPRLPFREHDRSLVWFARRANVRDEAASSLRSRA